MEEAGTSVDEDEDEDGGIREGGGEADHLEAPGGYAIWHGHHRRLSPSPVLSPTNPALPLPSLPASSFVPSVHLCSSRQPSYFRRRLEGNIYASVKLASRQEYVPFRSIPCSEPVENTFGWFVAGMSTLTSTRVLNMDRRYLTVD